MRTAVLITLLLPPVTAFATFEHKRQRCYLSDSHSPNISNSEINLSQDPNADDVSSFGGDNNSDFEKIIPEEEQSNQSQQRSSEIPSSSTSSTPALIVPIDGSIVVLLPAAVIAILGIITSIMVVGSSGDPILASQDDSAGGDLATAIVVKDIGSTKCRGLCGSQQDDLDNMREFMGKFAK